MKLFDGDDDGYVATILVSYGADVESGVDKVLSHGSSINAEIGRDVGVDGLYAVAPTDIVADAFHEGGYATTADDRQDIGCCAMERSTHCYVQLYTTEIHDLMHLSTAQPAARL